MSNVTPWPHVAGRASEPLPRPIVRPCDYGLMLAVDALETQLGTIEAYNRLAAAAAKLLKDIEAGNAKPQNQIFAVSPRGERPEGGR